MTATIGDTWEVTVDPNNPGFLVIHSATGSMPDMLIPIPAGSIKLVNTGGAIVFSGVLDAPGMDLEVVGQSIVVNPGSTIDLFAGSGFVKCAADSQGGAVSFRAIDSLTGAIATDGSITVNGSTIIGSSVKFAAFGSASQYEAVGGKSTLGGAVARAGAANSGGGASTTVPTASNGPVAPATPDQPTPQAPLTSEACVMTAGTHWGGGHDSSGHADLSATILMVAPGVAVVSEKTSSGTTSDVGSACARGPPVMSATTRPVNSFSFSYRTTLVDPSRRTSSLIEGSSETTNPIAAQAFTAFASDPSSNLIRATTAHLLTYFRTVSTRPAAPMTGALVRVPMPFVGTSKATYSASGKSSGESDVFAPTVPAVISTATVGAARISVVGIEHSGGSDVVASATTAALSAVVVGAARYLDLIGNDSGGSDVFAPAVAAALCALWPGWHGN